MNILTIVGARPQFIKASVVSRAISEYNKIVTDHLSVINEIIVHTGQHYDYNMNDIFFSELQIPKPSYFLGINRLSHGAMTGKMIEKIEEILMDERPDMVMVYGDTNSTLAGALAAAKLHIPIAHVEAGLRSFNRRMPEEINRILTDHISHLLFCPTYNAVKNLENEGITERVFWVGDVMYDAFLLNKELSDKKSNIMTELELKAGSYCLGTVHREENTDDPKRLMDIFAAFEKLSSDNCPFVVLLHPRTKKALHRYKKSGLNSSDVRLIPPVSYLDMIALEAHAKVILTDSGGVQKEAYFSEVPCVTLRDETEWTETVETGWNHLGGSDFRKIINAFQQAIESLPKKQSKLFGDGKASNIILRELISPLNHQLS